MNDLGDVVSSLRIVAADDDPVSRLMLERWLRPLARSMVAVEGPEAAWSLIETRKADALVTDLRFEGRETGLDLAERVRAWSPDFPIILVTAFGDQGALVRAIELGVDHVLIKPVQRVLLNQAVQKVIRQVRDRAALQAAQAEVAEQQRRLAALRKYEQRIGMHMQQDILYRALPGSYGALRCTQRIHALHEVNGDFVDAFVTVEGALDIVVGDAMGKGLSAAMLGAGLKTALMRLLIEARHTLAVEEICLRLAGELQPVLAQLDGLITMQYWRIDSHTGSLRFVDCGHTKAVLKRATSDTCILLHGENLPLGVMRETRYLVCEAVLMRGDRLLLVSDGIVDAFESADRAGLDELLLLIEGIHADDPSVLADAILRATDAGAVDDRSLLVLDWDAHTGAQARVLRVYGSADSLASLRQDIDQLLDEIASGEDELWRTGVEIGLVEAVNNAFRHGGADSVLGVTIVFAWDDDLLTCDLTYRGQPFRPETAARLPPDYSEGGYGRYIMEQCFDRVSYLADRGGRQAQSLIKHRRRGGPGPA